MLAGVVNVVFGVLFVFGGVQGWLVPRGSHGGLIIVAFGACLVMVGMKSIIKARSRPR
jgi:uncharacterized membrane protein (UPF0136 family)